MPPSLERSPGLRRRRIPFVASLLLLVAACSSSVVFDVTPTSFPECEGPNVVAHVTWDATSVTDDPVRIYVYKIGNPKVLWYQGAGKGKRDTGKWIADGSTLLLQTKAGKVLAERTMESTVCEGPKP